MAAGPRLTLQSIVVQNREPVAVEVDRQVVMMSVEREKYYGLDGVGGRIWKLIEEPCSVADLCVQLQKEFEVDEAECRQDVLSFLGQMASEGLIEVRGEAVSAVSSSAGA